MADPKYLQFVILKTGLEGSGARRRGKWHLIPTDFVYRPYWSYSWCTVKVKL